jgi:transcription factor E2F3
MEVSTSSASSLTALTERFQTLLQGSPGALDLNSAAVSLGVAKRRLYDVTAVMEGIGLLAKKGKSSVIWT